jgi:hypothetical protein
VIGEIYSMHETSKKSIRILVKKPEGKKPLTRLKHRWKDNIIYLKCIDVVAVQPSLNP